MTKEVEKTEEELYEDAWRAKLDPEEVEKEETPESGEPLDTSDDPVVDDDDEDDGEDNGDDGSTEEDSSKSKPESKEQKAQKSKDDEYREFIEGQPNEELKESARKLVQGLKSADGRASSLNKKLNAKEQLINQLYQSRQVNPQQTQAKPQPESARQEKPAQAQAPELPEKLKALKEKNPAAAAVIEEAAKHQSNITKRELEALIEEKMSAVNKQDDQSRRALELARLEDRAAPMFEKFDMSAVDVMRSEDFQYWLKLKRIEEPGVVELYQNASTADATLLVLEKYNREWEQEAAKQQAAQGSTEIEDQQKESSKTEQAQVDELKRKRKDRLKDAATVSSKRLATSTQDTGDGLSYEERWHQLNRKAEAKLNR